MFFTFQVGPAPHLDLCQIRLAYFFLKRLYFSLFMVPRVQARRIIFQQPNNRYLDWNWLFSLTTEINFQLFWGMFIYLRDASGCLRTSIYCRSLRSLSFSLPVPPQGHRRVKVIGIKLVYFLIVRNFGERSDGSWGRDNLFYQVIKNHLPLFHCFVWFFCSILKYNLELTWWCRILSTFAI